MKWKRIFLFFTFPWYVRLWNTRIVQEKSLERAHRFNIPPELFQVLQDRLTVSARNTHFSFILHDYFNTAVRELKIDLAEHPGLWSSVRAAFTELTPAEARVYEISAGQMSSIARSSGLASGRLLHGDLAPS